MSTQKDTSSDRLSRSVNNGGGRGGSDREGSGSAGSRHLAGQVNNRQPHPGALQFEGHNFNPAEDRFLTVRDIGALRSGILVDMNQQIQNSLGAFQEAVNGIQQQLARSQPPDEEKPYYGLIIGTGSVVRAINSTIRRKMKKGQKKGLFCKKSGPFDTQQEAEDWIQANLPVIGSDSSSDSSDDSSDGSGGGAGRKRSSDKGAPRKSKKGKKNKGSGGGGGGGDDDGDDSGNGGGGVGDDDGSGRPNRNSAPAAKLTKGTLLPPGPDPLSDSETRQFVTSDESTGKQHEVFGHEFQREKDFQKLMCPKGADEATRRNLTEALPDATQLPGALSSSRESEFERESDVQSVAQAILVNQGLHVRDATWNTSKRISLWGVKTEEDLHELDSDLGKCLAVIQRTIRLDYLDAIHALGWAKDREQAYCLGGYLPYIAQMMCIMYADLVRELARRSVAGWQPVKTDIKFFCTQLTRIRAGSKTRFRCMIYTYIYLRNQKADGWQSVSRLQSQMDALTTSRLPNGGGGGAGDTANPTSCPKCRTKFVHGVSRTSCPFRTLTNDQARNAGRVALRKIRDENTPKERAIAEAKAEIRGGNHEEEET
jgi:hypothetical protein